MRRRFGGSRGIEQQIEHLRQLKAGIDINALPSQQEQQIQEIHQQTPPPPPPPQPPP